MFENADVMHLVIITATIVFAIIFVILKTLDGRNRKFQDYEDRKAVMERYRRKIEKIRAMKAKKEKVDDS